MRFNIYCEIWIKCPIKVLKDLFLICCRAGFFCPEKINEINFNTSIYFSLYNLQFRLVVSYEIYKFWNQHDGRRFIPESKKSQNIERIEKAFFLKAWYKFVKKIASVIHSVSKQENWEMENNRLWSRWLFLKYSEAALQRCSKRY